MQKHTSTLLDNIYTDIPDCYDTGISGIFIFLHNQITILYSQYEIIKYGLNLVSTPKKTNSQQSKHFKILKIPKSLVKRNWPTLGLFEEESISSAFSLFMNTILFIDQNCFPMETIKL